MVLIFVEVGAWSVLFHSSIDFALNMRSARRAEGEKNQYEMNNFKHAIFSLSMSLILQNAVESGGVGLSSGTDWEY